MTDLILDPAAKALREKTARLSEEGQSAKFSARVARAIGDVVEDVSAEGGQVNISAIVTALVGGAAHYIAKLPAEGRQRQILFAQQMLPELVARHVALAQPGMRK